MSGGCPDDCPGCPDTLDQNQSDKVSGVRGPYKGPGPGQPGWWEIFKCELGYGYARGGKGRLKGWADDTATAPRTN